MKKIFFIALVALAAQFAVAQEAEYEYVPMVREGVQWYYSHILADAEQPMQRVGRIVELKGDTVINGVTYKKCYQRFLKKIRHKDHVRMIVCSDSPLLIAMVREEDKKVYAIFTPEYSSKVCNVACGLPYDTIDGEPEYLVYDFNDIIGHYQSTNEYWNYNVFFDGCYESGAVEINGTLRREYSYENRLVQRTVESIGQVFNEYGGLATFLSPLAFRKENCEDPIVSELFPATSHMTFLYLIEDGEIVFRRDQWEWWDPDLFDEYYSGIEDIKQVSEFQAHDTRWYSITGIAYDSKPTEPGIYIHQGRKVVVK